MTQTFCRTCPRGPIAPSVSMKRPILTRRLRRHPSRCPRAIDAPARWTPLCTAVPIGAVAIAAGWGWGTGVPTAIPVAASGDSGMYGLQRLFPRASWHPLSHGKQVAVELLVRVLACLAEGLGIRATARVFEVDPNTVLHWLVEAASSSRPLRATFCARYTSKSCNSMSCMPCSVPSRTGR
jgi:hypothetical protein